jgi:hypothetical protein
MENTFMSIRWGFRGCIHAPQFASRETGYHPDVDGVYAEPVTFVFWKTTGSWGV